MSIEHYTLHGMRIMVSPLLDNIPRMQLSYSVRQIVTPEFANEMDTWMREFFGTKSQAYTTRDGVVVMGPKALAKLKAQASASVTR